MDTHLFRPFVSISDNGAISIDWNDCYENTVSEDGMHTREDFPPNAEHASYILDRFVAERKLSGDIVPPMELATRMVLALLDRFDANDLPKDVDPDAISAAIHSLKTLYAQPTREAAEEAVELEVDEYHLVRRHEA